MFHNANGNRYARQNGYLFRSPGEVHRNNPQCRIKYYLPVVVEWKIRLATTAIHCQEIIFLTKDQINCTITADLTQSCMVSPNAMSNSIIMHVSASPAPSLQMDAGTLSICPGDSVLFYAIPKNAGWYRYFLPVAD